MPMTLHAMAQRIEHWLIELTAIEQGAFTPASQKLANAANYGRPKKNDH